MGLTTKHPVGHCIAFRKVYFNSGITYRPVDVPTLSVEVFGMDGAHETLQEGISLPGDSDLEH